MRERTEPDRELDRRLRAALEPEDERTDRVVRGALEAGKPRRPSLGLVAALAAGAVTLVLLGALLLPAIRPVSGPDPEAPSAAAAARYSVTNQDGVIVVRDPDGGATFLHAREPQDERPRGMRMIVRGGTRP